MLRRLLVAAACSLLACANGGIEGEEPTIDDPRAGSLAGTGSVDVAIVEASGELAREKGIAWWEVELRLLDDDASSGAISTDDATRVAIDFWAHGADGAVRAEGRFAVDVTQWLGLSVERDPEEIAAIFEGSDVREGGAPVSLEARAAHLSALLEAIATAKIVPPATGKALLSTKSGGGDGLSTCVSTVKPALASVASTFGSCTACAAHVKSDPTTDAAWKACDACEAAIKDAKKAKSLFDHLACKSALVLPATGGDSDDAGGSLITLPDGLESSTCWSKSKDKVHGTFRVTDGKGSVSCVDCPTGTIPVDTKLGCAPASSDTYSPVDESKALVLLPGGKGNAPGARVVSADACVLVEVTATGTVNGNPVEKGPRKAIYKLGEGRRGWAALPKNVQTSKDQWDLTTDTHTGSVKGKYAIEGSSTKRAKAPVPKTGTVEAAIARGGCSSRPVLGLSQQIAEEVSRCLRPGHFVQVPSGGSLRISADLAWLSRPAAEALAKAVRAKPGRTLRISSMYRTIAQQYFLFRRKACFSAVAPPGRSNHETGIAIDVSDPDNATFRSALQSVGFKWLGSFDRFHFDYRGPGSVDLRGDDVKAFQRLWNRNHPEDKIAEDGAFGPDTEKRLKMSPADGFPKGVPLTCGPAEKAPTAKGSAEPLTYLTNVTTSELLPGQGCETGSDASHSSVDACISVKQICEPYWCDLADQRPEACR